MQLCSDGHDEVAYEGTRQTICPVCKTQQEMQEVIDQLSQQIDEHECKKD